MNSMARGVMDGTLKDAWFVETYSPTSMNLAT